jgi:hypothetical protein
VAVTRGALDRGGEETAMADEKMTVREPEAKPERRVDRGADGSLGEVARHAIDHTQEILRDTLAIARLEVRRGAQRAIERTREEAPRVGYAVFAGLLILTGAVLGLIAIFIGLGEAIPSVGWRLAIYAIAFLLAGSVAMIPASRSAAERERKSRPRRFEASAQPRQRLEAPPPRRPLPAPAPASRRPPPPPRPLQPH